MVASVRKKRPILSRCVPAGASLAQVSMRSCARFVVSMPMPRHSARRVSHMKAKTIKVDYLARVEGEGALYVKIKGDKVTDVKLKIFEPPRFFEALLRGRMYSEAPDITARICGICPVAYQMSAVHAMEHAYPDIVKRGLHMKKAGNAIVAFLGGREIHPINVRVGGFYKVPSKQEFGQLTEQLKWGRDAALETVRWTAQLPFPGFEQNYEFVALHHPAEYPFNEGRLVSNKGLDIAAQAYDTHFVEEHVPYSNALHSVLKERGAYFVGPLARYNLNFDQLSPLAQEAARAAGLGPTCRNPFQSILVRSVEVLYAFDEALRIIEGYERPDKPAVELHPRASVGYAITEAPRGILYHRYQLNDKGLILDAKIVPPTSQNQKTIENDLRNYVAQAIDVP